MDNEMIEGVVYSIVFANPDNGYTVLRLETNDGVSTAAGFMPGVSVGERLLLKGVWTTHQQYGEQFKTQSFEMKPPTGVDEIYRYLASGAIKNIGPAKARDIVNKFGGNSLSVIENEPELLSSVKGISMKSALLISEGYKRQAGLRRLIDFFAKYSITPLIATRVYKDYGDESIEVIIDNPYIIAADSYGADFSEADAIALELGFESDSPERVSAAVIFELMHNLDNGHTFIPRAKLINATKQLIGVGVDAVEDSLEALNECGDVVIETIAGEEGCYLRHMYDAETYAAMRLSDMARMRKAPDNLDNIIRGIERRQNITYAKLQVSALEIAAMSSVMALTGGPGTGKTTTIRGILMLYDELGLKTSLCAPTGRAAKRLSETCKRDAATIHRMLGATLGEEGVHIFDHDEDNPLGADVIIVDESSMVDILLMQALLAAMKRGSRLIMVGDADQLPSVGPGNVFADVIKSGCVPTVSLTEIFRQSEDSGIVICAHDVNNGTVPEMVGKYRDIFFMKRLSEQQLAETVVELYGQRLPENMGIDHSQIQVLTPTRKMAAGTVALNDLLRDKVNPSHPQKKEKQWGEYLYRVTDKVMQNRNNYDIMWRSIDGGSNGTGVFNGDIGTIKNIDHDSETVSVVFDDKVITYLFEQLPELEPAYALTVHKSQGSEYRAVILAMASGIPQLLTRSLLYTAMTRAKELLVIVGSMDVMSKMVENNRRQKRYSGLSARLQV